MNLWISEATKLQLSNISHFINKKQNESMNFRSTELQPLNKTSALWKISHKKHSHKVVTFGLYNHLALTPLLYARKNKDLKDLQTLSYCKLCFILCQKQLSIAQPSTYAGQNFPVALAITTQSFYCKVKKPNCLAFYSHTHFTKKYNYNAVISLQN